MQMCGGTDGSFAQQGADLDPISLSPSQIFCEEPVITFTIAHCHHLPVLSTYGQWPDVWEDIVFFFCMYDEASSVSGVNPCSFFFGLTVITTLSL
jgi:hypothetical protein